MRTKYGPIRVLRPRSVLILPVVVLALVAAACSDSSADEDQVQIGFFEIVDVDVVRDMEDGFRAAMRDEGFIEGDNVIYIVKNAQNEIPNASVIATQFVDLEVDLVYGLGTPVVQAMYGETSEIPQIFGGMTDPVSGGVVDSFEAPGGHATGTSDLVPPGDQLDILLQILPDLATVGTINNPAEANSVAWQVLLEAAAAERDIEVIAVPVSNSNEVQPAIAALAGRVDAIMLTPDNTVESAMPVVIDTAADNGIPLLSPKSAEAANGALVGMGVDYYQLGLVNGHQAAAILRGEADTATTPVQTMPFPITVINLTTAETLGLTIPQSLLDTENVEAIR